MRARVKREEMRGENRKKKGGDLQNSEKNIETINTSETTDSSK